MGTRWSNPMPNGNVFIALLKISCFPWLECDNSGTVIYAKIVCFCVSTISFNGDCDFDKWHVCRSWWYASSHQIINVWLCPHVWISSDCILNMRTRCHSKKKTKENSFLYSSITNVLNFMQGPNNRWTSQHGYLAGEEE